MVNTFEPPSALVLDDDQALSGLFSKVLESQGFKVSTAHRVADARRIILEKAPKLMLVDIDLPDGNGLDLMAELNNNTRGRFIVISGNTSQRAVIKSIKCDAKDVLIKPVDLAQLRQVIERTSAVGELGQEASNDSRTKELTSWIEIGQSPVLKQLKIMIGRAASHPTSHVLIEGESGTQKFSVAQLIHERSRRSGSLIRMNCATENDARVSERLFGLEDPETNECVHTGYLEQAAGGTLVIDDITELDLSVQSKLLSFMKTGRFRRVNGRDSIGISVATVTICQDQADNILESGVLRSDLYFHLAQYTMKVPALRQCMDDALRFAQYHCQVLASKYGRPISLSANAEKLICQSQWSNNVLELTMALNAAAAALGQSESEITELDTTVKSDREETYEINQLVGTTFWELEKQLLLATLDHHAGDKRATAKMLGISLKTLYNRINAYQ